MKASNQEQTISLTFNEDKFRAIYEPYYASLHDSRDARKKLRLKMMLIFGCLALPFLLLAITFPNLAYVGFILIVFTLYQGVRILMNNKFFADTEASSRADVEQFIEFTKDKNELKYVYNDTSLKYLVDGELLGSELEWKDANSYYTDDSLVMVYFSNPTSEIMLPKSMTRSSEFKAFITHLENLDVPKRS